VGKEEDDDDEEEDDDDENGFRSDPRLLLLSPSQSPAGPSGMAAPAAMECCVYGIGLLFEAMASPAVVR
jgi:hypothetical protein